MIAPKRVIRTASVRVRADLYFLRQKIEDAENQGVKLTEDEAFALADLALIADNMYEALKTIEARIGPDIPQEEEETR